MSAIDAGIHAIRAGRHLCDEALRYLWTGTSRRTHFFLPVSRPNSLAIRLIGLDFVRLFSSSLIAIGGADELHAIYAALHEWA
jgi:hypothetical protein